MGTLKYIGIYRNISGAEQSAYIYCKLPQSFVNHELLQYNEL